MKSRLLPFSRDIFFLDRCHSSTLLSRVLEQASDLIESQIDPLHLCYFPSLQSPVELHHYRNNDGSPAGRGERGYAVCTMGRPAVMSRLQVRFYARHD